MGVLEKIAEIEAEVNFIISVSLICPNLKLLGDMWTICLLPILPDWPYFDRWLLNTDKKFTMKN